MRFFYADPGLVNNLGHHASSCRFITQELGARGIDTRVLAFARVDNALRIELRAEPHFRTFTYWTTDRDPICGWLNAFYVVAQATRDDLMRITDITSHDVLYLNSGQAAQLLGIALWLGGMAPDKTPQVVLEFGVDPGLNVQFNDRGCSLSTRDPRQDATAVLLRHAACQIPKAVEHRLHLVTFEMNSSVAYQALLQRDVGVLPLPRLPVTPCQSRAGKRPITVAVIGHQRPDKGYQFMPDICRRLLAADPNINILVHNGDPRGMPEIQQSIRAQAEQNRRLIVDERTAGEQIWSELLQAADLMLCPYQPERFAISYSAVAADAVANGIPLVVPAGTSMARLLQEFGGAGATFDKAEPACIANSVLQALRRFDEMAALAAAAVKHWGNVHGPIRFVNSLLRLTATSL